MPLQRGNREHLPEHTNQCISLRFVEMHKFFIETIEDDHRAFLSHQSKHLLTCKPGPIMLPRSLNKFIEKGFEGGKRRLFCVVVDAANVLSKIEEDGKWCLVLLLRRSAFSHLEQRTGELLECRRLSNPKLTKHNRIVWRSRIVGPFVEEFKCAGCVRLMDDVLCGVQLAIFK